MRKKKKYKKEANLIIVPSLKRTKINPNDKAVFNEYRNKSPSVSCKESKKGNGKALKSFLK
jgi:hypothetical protein